MQKNKMAHKVKYIEQVKGKTIEHYYRKKQIKMNMQTLLAGGAGAGGIEVIGAIPTTDEAQQIGQLLLQILVAIITIIKLIKDKKTEK